jgi:type IV secretory pathway TraG/TraD family ATPase VirD4
MSQAQYERSIYETRKFSVITALVISAVSFLSFWAIDFFWLGVLSIPVVCFMLVPWMIGNVKKKAALSAVQGDVDHIRGAHMQEINEWLVREKANALGWNKEKTGQEIIAAKLKGIDFKPDLSFIKRPFVRIAGVPIPEKVENLHFAICASTGAGKSVTLRGMLKDIRERGDRAVIIDNGGEFMTKFGQPDDIVLSPFDPRSQGWSVKNEIRAPHDWLRIARSVIPDGHGSEKPWHEMAQKLFANTGINLAELADNKTLLDVCTAYSGKQLAPILSGTSSAVLTQEGGEKLLTNIRSVFGTTLAAWQFMKSGEFSLRNYMLADDKRWLFIPFQESEFGVAKDLIAAWMDILVSSGLERPEGSQTTWIIIDELDTLGTLSSLVAATTKLRKRGVPIVVAFQSYSQLERNYGAETATTLLNCFSNKFVMRSVDGNTAERLSKELGDRESIRASFNEGASGSRSSDGRSASTSIGMSESIHMGRTVLPSEIQNLPDLVGYLKFAGDYPILRARANL